MMGRAWTEGEHAQMLAMHREGTTARQIARHLGRDATTVRDLLRAAGQTLRVRYIQGAGNMEGNVSFQAATLTGILP